MGHDVCNECGGCKTPPRTYGCLIYRPCKCTEREESK